MNKSRVVLVAALGAMTPALLLKDGAKAHTAHQAGTAESQNGTLNIGLDQGAMKSALLALSPADKLRMAGDRIRLARARKKSARKHRGLKRLEQKRRGQKRRGACNAIAGVACGTGNLDFTYKHSCMCGPDG